MALLANDNEAILEVIEDITKAWTRSPAYKKPVAAILSYLTLTQSINDYKIMLLGQEAPTMRANAIMNLSTQEIAKTIPDAQVSDALFSSFYMQQRLAQLYQKTGNDRYSFYDIKLRSFIAEVQKRDAAVRYIEALQGPDPRPISKEELAGDSAQITEWFSEIYNTRQYGVKMGYIPDERGGSLMFGPPYDLRDFFDQDFSAVHPLTMQIRAVADIIHSRAEEPTKLQPDPVLHTKQDSGEALAGSLNAGSLDPLSFLQLGPDGELYVDRQCTVSYAEIARSHGKYYAYRDLQATILAHYFDLTHSVEGGAEPIPHTTSLFTANKEPLISIERLVLPRLKRYRFTEATSAKTDEPRVVKRHHEVEWHTRKLPPGWQASPAALELAEKLEVTLQPGETIVKKHERGSKALGEIAGHQFVTLN